MFDDASFALAEEPPWSSWRAMALILSAEAQLLLGDPERATALFVAASAVAGELGNVNVVAIGNAELALLAMDDGRWAEAAEKVQCALATVDRYRLHDYSMSLLTFTAAARLALHRGDRKEIDRQLARAMRARPSCTVALPYVAVRARLQLAKVYAAIADQATARHLLREIDEISLQRPALGVLHQEILEFRAILKDNAQVTVAGGTPLTPAELRLLPYLQTHLTFKEIGAAALRVAQHRQL